MQEKYIETIEKIFLNTPLKKITWDDFFLYFDEDTQNSPEFFEILNEIQNKGITIVDKIQYSENINELEASTYIIAQANNFSEILPTLRKYPDGDIFCDYLSGIKMQAIAEKKQIEKNEVVKKLKKFVKYISCSELDIPLLGIYIKYDLKPKEFSKIMCIDEVTSKYLYLKFAILDESSKKNYKISEDFKERLKGIPIRL